MSANPVAYSYTQTGLTNGTQYTFRARGINLRGKGTVSDPKTATPAGPPAKPTALTAAASTSGAAKVTLSWTAPSNTATAPIDKYQYRARNVPNNWLAWQDIPGSSKSTTTYAVTQTVTGSNLAYNELYGFQVRAVSVGGAGAVSDERQARPVFGVPPAPSLVSAAGGNAQAGLSWTSAMTRWIDKWQYQHSSDNGTTWTTWTDIPANSGKYRECRETAPNVVTCSDISTPEQGGTRFTRYALITGLENGKTYKLKVRSANAAGPGDASDAVTATTLPLAPATFTATGRDAEVALAWTKNAADATVTGWQYRQKAGTGKYGPWTPIIGSKDSTTTHTVTELTNDTAYTFQLRAVNATGAGAPSAERTANPQLSPPLKPAGFQAHAGDGLAMLQWDDPENASLTKWQYKQDGGSWEDICVTSSDSGCPRKTSHLVKGLTNGTEYTFKIRAVNDAGNGPDSDEKKATPLAVPGQPTDLAATGGDKQVSLVWKAPSGSVTGWQVRQASAGGSWGNWKTITPGSGANNTLTHTATGLTNNVPYRFQVRATNASGGGTPSAPASATPVSGVPTASTYLWAAGGDRSAALRWNKMAGHWVDSWEYRYKTGSGGYGSWTGRARFPERHRAVRPHRAEQRQALHLPGAAGQRSWRRRRFPRSRRRDAAPGPDILHANGGRPGSRPRLGQERQRPDCHHPVGVPAEGRERTVRQLDCHTRQRRRHHVLHRHRADQQRHIYLPTPGGERRRHRPGVFPGQRQPGYPSARQAHRPLGLRRGRAGHPVLGRPGQRPDNQVGVPTSPREAAVGRRFARPPATPIARRRPLTK